MHFLYWVLLLSALTLTGAGIVEQRRHFGSIDADPLDATTP